MSFRECYPFLSIMLPLSYLSPPPRSLPQAGGHHLRWGHGSARRRPKPHHPAILPPLQLHLLHRAGGRLQVQDLLHHRGLLDGLLPECRYLGKPGKCREENVHVCTCILLLYLCMYVHTGVHVHLQYTYIHVHVHVHVLVESFYVCTMCALAVTTTPI